MNSGLLLLRLVLGLTMAAHGSQKLFGWFGGAGLAATGVGFEKMGFSHPKLNATLAAFSESLAGLFLSLGLATPLGAMLLFSVMLVATLRVHLPFGFFIQNRGFEYNLVLGLGGLSLAFTGPGAFSLDSLFGWNAKGLYWGLAATALGILGTAPILLGRRPTAAPKAN